MKYEVIEFFTDLQDGDHAYNVGDEFPRKGHEVSEERLAELLTDKNKRKRPLIKMVSAKEAEEGLSEATEDLLNNEAGSSPSGNEERKRRARRTQE